MIPGKCRLCLRDGLLCSSHLIPKAIYRFLRAAGHNNPNPVFFDSKTQHQTSLQLQDYLLCEQCELRFKQRGEDWVLANCYRGRNSFRLFKSLEEGGLIYDDADFKAYAAAKVAAVDTEAMVYFAASVFWRAAVHSWRLRPRTEPVRIDLGPYEDPLRRYLMEETVLPDGIVVHTRIWSSENMNLAAMFPQGDRQDDGYVYRFIIPGLVFTMLVGSRLQGINYRISLSHSPYKIITLYRTLDARITQNLAVQVQRIAGLIP